MMRCMIDQFIYVSTKNKFNIAAAGVQNEFWMGDDGSCYVVKIDCLEND